MTDRPTPPRHEIEKKLSEHVRNSNPLSTRAIFKSFHETACNDDIPQSGGRTRALRSHYQKHLNDVDGMIKSTDIASNDDSQTAREQVATVNAESTVMSSIQQFNFFSYFLPTIDSSLPSEQLALQNAPPAPAVTFFSSPTYILHSTPTPVQQFFPNQKSTKNHLPPTPPFQPGQAARNPDNAPLTAASPSTTSIKNSDISWIPKLNHAQRMSSIEKKQKYLEAQNHVNNTVAKSSSSKGHSSESDAKRIKSVMINLTPMKSYSEGGGLYGKPVTISPGKILDVNELLLHGVDYDDNCSHDDNNDDDTDDDDYGDHSKIDVDFAINMVDKRSNLKSRLHSLSALQRTLSANAIERRASATVDTASPGPVSSLIEHFESTISSSTVSMVTSDPILQYSGGDHSWSLVPKSYETGIQSYEAKTIYAPIDNSHVLQSKLNAMTANNSDFDYSNTEARLAIMERAAKKLSLVMDYIAINRSEEGHAQPFIDKSREDQDNIKLSADLYESIGELRMSLAAFLPAMQDIFFDCSSSTKDLMHHPSMISGSFVESIGVQTEVESLRILESVGMQTQNELSTASSSVQTEVMPPPLVISALVQTEVMEQTESERKKQADLFEIRKAEISNAFVMEIHQIKQVHVQTVQFAARNLATVMDELILAKAAALIASQEADVLRTKIKYYETSAKESAENASTHAATLQELKAQIEDLGKVKIAEKAEAEEQIALLQSANSVATAELSKQLCDKEEQLMEIQVRASGATIRLDKADKEIIALKTKQVELENNLRETENAQKNAVVNSISTIQITVGVQTQNELDSASVQTEDILPPVVMTALVQNEVLLQAESKSDSDLLELQSALQETERTLFETNLRLDEALLEAEKQRLQSIMEISKMKRASAEDKISMEQLASDLESTFETLALTLVELSMKKETNEL